jgi:hypothetical protein
MAHPQSSDLVYQANARTTNGVAPGYWPTIGSGLTLNLSAGTMFNAGAIIDYAAGTLAMADGSTNYVYLDSTNSFIPAVNQTGFIGDDVPIAIVNTQSGVIQSVQDVRTMFVAPGGGGGGVPTSRMISTTTPLAGGGDLTANRTLSLASRGTAAISTGTIAAGSYETGNFALGKFSIVAKVVANFWCRVRLYSTAADRDADLGRVLGGIPAATLGTLIELVLDSDAKLTYVLRELAPIANMDGSPTTAIYYTVTNLTGVSHAYTVTFTRFLLES